MTSRGTVAVDDGGAGTVVLRLSGDIDMLCADTVARAGRDALANAPGTRTIIVDLADVGFVDSSGLSALVRLRRTADDAGVDLQLRAVPRSVGVLLRLAGLDQVFHIV